MTGDRIDLLVALSVKNQMHPYKNSFPDFVAKVCSSKLQISPQATRNEIKTLNAAWQGDKWQSIIKNNSYQITPEEVEAWQLSYMRVSCTL